jgi:hypothetical protein
MPSKAGKKGEFHHTFGAVRRGDRRQDFPPAPDQRGPGRQSFIDLDTEYRPTGRHDAEGRELPLW